VKVTLVGSHFSGEGLPATYENAGPTTLAWNGYLWEGLAPLRVPSFPNVRIVFFCAENGFGWELQDPYGPFASGIALGTCAPLIAISGADPHSTPDHEEVSRKSPAYFVFEGQ